MEYKLPKWSNPIKGNPGTNMNHKTTLRFSYFELNKTIISFPTYLIVK